MRNLCGVCLTFIALGFGLCWLIVEGLALVFLLPLTMLIRAKSKLLEDHDVGQQ